LTEEEEELHVKLRYSQMEEVKAKEMKKQRAVKAD